MPPKIIRIVNGEIREIDEEPPRRRIVRNGHESDDSDGSGDDGPGRSAEDVVAQRLFGGTPSSSAGPTFDFTKPPLAVAWEDRANSLAGLPGLSIFGAHLSSRWLAALAVATAALGLARGLLAGLAVWVLYKLGIEGEGGRGGSGGAHRLGAHPHSGALPARALASYLAAAGGGRAAAAAAAGAPAAATAAATRTVGGSAGAASAKKRTDSEDVRNATRNAWAAREAARGHEVAAAKAAAAEKSASKE